MTHEDFSNVVEQRFGECRRVLIDKAKEYTPGDDRFSNFKTAGAYLGCSPEMALLGMLVKHLVALRDFVGVTEKGGTVSAAQWNEKIGDSINYLVLLDGLLQEREWKSRQPKYDSSVGGWITFESPRDTLTTEESK